MVSKLSPIGGGCRYKMFVIMNYVQITIGISLLVYGYAMYNIGQERGSTSKESSRGEDTQLPFSTITILAGLLCLGCGALGRAIPSTKDSTTRYGMSAGFVIVCVLNCVCFAPQLIAMGLVNYVQGSTAGPNALDFKILITTGVLELQAGICSMFLVCVFLSHLKPAKTMVKTL